LALFFTAQFPLFQRPDLSIALSLLVISTLSAAVFLSTHISDPTRPADHVVPVFILIFAINTMMPLPGSVALGASLTLATLQLLLAGLMSNDFQGSLLRQVRTLQIQTYSHIMHSCQ
jgi:hypothetical protein